MWHWGNYTASIRGLTKLEQCMKGAVKRHKAKIHTFGSVGQSLKARVEIFEGHESYLMLLLWLMQSTLQHGMGGQF
uniref:Uncharacterized protein n=1 Tax=Arundo donax TaxID=35708 RepID=A0A0A9F114_ARUDO